MQVNVFVLGQPLQTFANVEGFSFYIGRDNNTGKAVAQWTKHYDDNPSEEWVNLDPSMLTVSSVDMFDGTLQAFAKTTVQQ